MPTRASLIFSGFFVHPKIPQKFNWVCECVYGVLWWTGIPFRFNSCLMHSIPGKVLWSNALAKRMQLNIHFNPGYLNTFWVLLTCVIWSSVVSVCQCRCQCQCQWTLTSCWGWGSFGQRLEEQPGWLKVLDFFVSSFSPPFCPSLTSKYCRIAKLRE